MRILAATVAMMTAFVPAAASQGLSDALSPEMLKAIGDVKILSQELDFDAPMPAVLLQIRNDSERGFSLLFVECAIMQGSKMVGSAEGAFMNLQPGQTAAASAYVLVTKQMLDADRADCRPGIAL